jgi:glycosyltransferase involved in cell wall biosynthesis
LMRIAVFHDLPSGGSKRALFELARRLARRHDVDVFSFSTADHTFCDLRPVVREHRIIDFTPLQLFHSPFGRLNQAQRWRDLQRLDRLTERLGRALDAGHYDVVFAHPCLWTQAPLVLCHTRTPAVYYCEEPPRVLYEPSLQSVPANGLRRALDRVDPLLQLYRSSMRAYDRQALHSAQRVLVNSKFMQSCVAQIYDIRPHVCYLGVDADTFSPDASVARQDYVLSVGALQRTKGFDFVIESIAKLPAHIRPALRIVANFALARERDSLNRLAANLGVTLQIEVGISQQALVQRYRECMLVVYAPVNEPFGLVPLEAMACGVPVVGVREGGVRETVVDGVTGLLTERDAQQFADAMLAVLADPSNAARLGKQAREYTELHWTWDASVGRIEEHLGSVAYGNFRDVGSAGLEVQNNSPRDGTINQL